jgi:hypothetical protein
MTGPAEDGAVDLHRLAVGADVDDPLHRGDRGSVVSGCQAPRILDPFAPVKLTPSGLTILPDLSRR